MIKIIIIYEEDREKLSVDALRYAVVDGLSMQNGEWKINVCKEIQAEGQRILHPSEEIKNIKVFLYDIQEARKKTKDPLEIIHYDATRDGLLKRLTELSKMGDL